MSVEPPEVRAENQSEDYFASRPAPNLFVSAVRIGSPPGPTYVRVRIQTAGGGSSQREHFRSISLYLLAGDDERRARLCEFLTQIEARFPGMTGALADPDKMAKAIEQFGTMYISNPPGMYDMPSSTRPLAERGPATLSFVTSDLW